MVIVQKRSQRKPSGARYKKTLTKRLHQKGGRPAHTAIGEKRMAVARKRGGSGKDCLLAADKVNVFDGKKYVQAKVELVAENAANRHFVRRNIMTKGAIVQTDIGKVRITNRPGQEGSLQGVLVK